MNDEKRYFLKNSNLLEEIHKSKLTYCCCNNNDYKNYNIICDGYSLVTPNVIDDYFVKNPTAEYIIIRVATDEHILPYIKSKNGKVNLQDIKMSPFKHYLLMKRDFLKVFEESGCSAKLIDEKTDRIKKIKEQIKDNNRNIRFNKLNKELQIPYKEFNQQCDLEIKQLVSDIKKISTDFSSSIKTKMIEVLRSHWTGDTIESGSFSVSHGKLTNGLVYMLMMLVDQFAKSGNWSGYTYLEDMKSSAIVQLCDVVLKFEEKKSSNPFAYLTQIVSMKFTATLNSEKVQRKIKSTMLQDMGYDPTFGEQTEEEYKYKVEEWNENENLNQIDNVNENLQ